MYDAPILDRLSLAAAGIAIVSLVAFAVLFDADMRGNERALVEVGLAAVPVGVALMLFLRRGLRMSSATLIPIALLLVALVVGVVSLGDLRTDRGNKKALVALGIAAMSGSALITSLVVRRPPEV